LPKGVAQDWRDWSLMTEYLFDDASVNSDGYGRFPGRIYARGFSDDTGFAPPAAVAHLLSKFTSAQIDSKTMTPTDAGASRVGHFGFFRKENDALWKSLAEWIEADINAAAI
jgi:predicted alpha/beta hydrolase